MFARAYAVAAVILGSTTVQAARPVPRPPRVVTVIAHDYAFTIAGGSAAALPAGPTTFRLVNDGKEMHMMGVSRLDSGSIASFAKAIAANAAPAMKEYGGVNGVTPGHTATSTLDLVPGHYVLVCWLMTADHKLHAGLGMMLPIEVVASNAPAAAPVADLAITLRDYALAIDKPVHAGTHTFRVDNQGPLAHDVVLLRMDPGATTSDIDAWLAHPATGSPRAHPMGGLVGLEKGFHGWFTATLPAGDYALVCLMPDDKGVPHYSGHHMQLDFHVSG